MNSNDGNNHYEYIPLTPSAPILSPSLWAQPWSPTFFSVLPDPIISTSLNTTEHDTEKERLKELLDSLAADTENLKHQIEKLSEEVQQLKKWATALNPVIGRLITTTLDDEALDAPETQQFVECGEMLNHSTDKSD